MTGEQYPQTDQSTTTRVLVGDSVYEWATLTTSGLFLHIEFEADDLDSVSIAVDALALVGLTGKDEDGPEA